MDIGTIWAAAAIPLLILIARIAEASLESVRTIYISKGHANRPKVYIISGVDENVKEAVIGNEEEQFRGKGHKRYHSDL